MPTNSESKENKPDVSPVIKQIATEAREYLENLRKSKNPEQQPIPEPEKSPTDVELDIDAAKKYLEEVYGKDKSSITVDKSMPTLENQETKKAEKEELQKDNNKSSEKSSVVVGAENTQRFYTAEVIDKSIPIVEKKETKKESENKTGAKEIKPGLEKEDLGDTEKKEPTAEEKLAEIEKIKKAQEEKATKEAQIRNAKDELINLVEAIKASNKESEKYPYSKVKEVFEVATGESLEEIAWGKAKIEAESEGYKIMMPEEYIKIKTTGMQDGIRQRERSAIIRWRWDMLSDKEKKDYFGKEEDKNNQENINSARIKFAVELDRKRQKLSEGKNGITISEDLFYKLMGEGLKAEDIKKRGFWERMFGDEITIPPLNNSALDKRGPLVLTKDGLITREVEAKKRIAEVAEGEIKIEIREKQNRLKERRQRHIREITQETATEFKKEKEVNVKPLDRSQTLGRSPTGELGEAEPVTNSSLEIAENLKRFENISDIEKLIKKVDSYEGKKQEEAKKIKERINQLKKKIKQGKVLTLREVVFLNNIDSVLRKKAEK
ncbi:MAG: hypothetical protein AAB957_00655 [Patescibacteria group bacterium]